MAHANHVNNQTQNENDQKWLTIIEEWRQSGLSISEWCRHHEEITYDQFMHHRRRLFPEVIGSNAFMKQATTWSTLTMEMPSSSLDVVINDCRVVVPSGFDQDLLRDVVGVLKDC